MDTCTIISLIAESSSDDDCIFEISDDEELLESLIESVGGMFIIPAKYKNAIPYRITGQM